MKFDAKSLLIKNEFSYSIRCYLILIFLPLFFYVIAILGYFKFISLKIEIHSIVMMGLILFFWLFLSRHNASFIYYSFIKNMNSFKTDLKEFIVSNLLEINEDKKSKLGFDDFINKYDLRNENLASIGSSLFPMLGILGTFVSIAISLPSFNSDSKQGLENEIAQLLSGVGTAFYISIYGIFLAILWLFFEKNGLAKFSKFINEQKEVSKEFFWQKDELQYKMINLACSHFKSMDLLLSRITNETFFSRLDSLVEQKFNSFEKLQNIEQDLLSQSKIIIEQKLKFLDKAKANQDEFTKINSEILNNISKFLVTLKDSQLQFSTQYNRLEQVMQDRNLDKNLSKLENVIFELNSSLKNFQINLSNEQKMWLNQFRNSLIEGIKAFREVYISENVEIDNKDLKKSIDDLNKEVDQILNSVKDNE